MTTLAAQNSMISVRQTFDFCVDTISRLNIYSTLWAEAQRKLHDSFAAAIANPQTDVTINDWTNQFNKTVAAHQGRKIFATWVAVADDQPVGFIQTNDGQLNNMPYTGMISNLSVHPDYWGRDIGRRLLCAAEAHIKQCGYERGALYVEYNNKRARRHYHANGWSEVKGQVLFGELNGRTASFLELRKNM